MNKNKLLLEINQEIAISRKREEVLKNQGEGMKGWLLRQMGYTNGLSEARDIIIRLEKEQNDQ